MTTHQTRSKDKQPQPTPQPEPKPNLESCARVPDAVTRYAQQPTPPPTAPQRVTHVLSLTDHSASPFQERQTTAKGAGGDWLLTAACFSFAIVSLEDFTSTFLGCALMSGDQVQAGEHGSASQMSQLCELVSKCSSKTYARRSKTQIKPTIGVLENVPQLPPRVFHAFLSAHRHFSLVLMPRTPSSPQPSRNDVASQRSKTTRRLSTAVLQQLRAVCSANTCEPARFVPSSFRSCVWWRSCVGG
jgi:hypothetical protein